MAHTKVLDPYGAVDKAKQTNIRLSDDMHSKLSRIAKSEGLNLTNIVIRAIEEYLDRIDAKICQGCKAVNKPNCNYCCNCGLPLNPEGLDEFKKMSEFFINRIKSTNNTQNTTE